MREFPTNTTETHPPAKRWLPVVAALIVTAIACIAFVPVINNDFILWDDNVYIFANDALSRPLTESIPWFFGLHFFAGNYHPLTMTLYAVLYQFAGTTPDVFHCASFVIHLANVLLVFWFAWLLSGRRLTVAVITSLFFGIHPMHVESVAWASELKDMLYTLFFMTGLITYLRYITPGNRTIQGNNRWLLALTFLFFVLSVLSKPAAVAFPLVLPLIDFYCRHPLTKNTWLEKLPFFIVAVVFGIITISAQQSSHLVHDSYPFYQRILFASYSFVTYIVKLFVPAGLSNFYPYPDSAHLSVVFFIAPIIIAALAVIVCRTLKFTRVIAFGFLFFAATIVLELQLISVGDAIMADRYTYVPYIGLLFMIAMGINHLVWKMRIRLQRATAFVVFMIVGVTACVFFVRTNARCKVWRNNDTIATDLYQRYPEAPIAAHNMAAVYFSQGKYREAINLFSKVIRAKKDYLNEYVNLANAYIAIGASDSAVAVMQSALPYVKPADRKLYLSMGYDLITLHKYDAAGTLLDIYCRLQKDDPNGHIALAQSRYEAKNYNGYIDAIDTGLKYCRDNYNLLNQKGYTLLQNGKFSEAIPFFEASLKSQPDYTKAAQNLALCRHAIDSLARTHK